MDRIFEGLPLVTRYIDDVPIHSKDTVEHITHLHRVCWWLVEAGLTLCIRGHRCSIGKTEVTYLRRTFMFSGVMPRPEKLKADV